MNRIAFDTETYYDDDCSVTTYGPQLYCERPEWECYLVSVCDGESTWAGHPRDLNWAALGDRPRVSHNKGFDQAVDNRMGELGVKGQPHIVPVDWKCSADLCAYLSGHRALDKAVRHLYKHDLSKEMRGYMKGKRWDKIPKDKQKQLTEYARHDAYWCWRLWNDYSARWPEKEQRISDFNVQQGRRGVVINTDLLGQYREAVAKELFEVERSLPWIERGRKPTSTIAIAEQCRMAGIACPPTKKDDEEGFEEWFKQHVGQNPWIKAVADWRSINKIRATLETFKDRLRPDNSVEVLLKYFGAHTGRFSGDGGLNFTNFRKKPLVCAGIPIDVRRLIIPRPGKKFILCDLGQIEPRVLAWITRNRELLAMMQKINIYEAFARMSGEWTGEGALRHGNPDLYALKKVQVLQLGYQCGWERFKETASADYGIELTEEQAKSTVESFRAQNPLIVDLWGSLKQDFQNSLNDNFEMTLPGGRVMTYRNVKRTVTPRTEPDGTIVRDWAWTAEVTKQGRTVRDKFYGGKLTENLVQATSREVFVEHLRKLSDAGFTDIPFHTYDEAVVECDLDVQPRDIEHIMSTTPEWLPGCPLAAEAQETTHYKK